MPSSRISIYRGSPRWRTCASSASRSARRVVSSAGGHTAFQPRQPVAEARHGVASCAGESTGSSCGVGMLVGAVGHLVHDRLRVGPDPRDRPEQAAEDQRQQAQRADRLELRMVPLVGDLLGQDVHHPEQHDEDDGDDEEHDEGDERRRACPPPRARAARPRRGAGRPAAGRTQAARSSDERPAGRAAEDFHGVRGTMAIDLTCRCTTHGRLERALVMSLRQSTRRAIATDRRPVDK